MNQSLNQQDICYMIVCNYETLSVIIPVSDTLKQFEEEVQFL